MLVYHPSIYKSWLHLATTFHASFFWRNAALRFSLNKHLPTTDLSVAVTVSGCSWLDVWSIEVARRVLYIVVLCVMRRTASCEWLSALMAVSILIGSIELGHLC